MSDGVVLADQLRAAVADAARRFGSVPSEQTARRPHRDKWCAREILGHLIDSAANNHRRFVVGQADPALTFDSYA